ncbi:pirin family protein [Vibrio agarivorans]|uniref:pirin family protein n=1 Tax=Vibrio agarivorans TaxID=153622 RepID=UPI00222FC835|nr:pirin family protein [Vibrio agarivorans]MDN3663483.1 pirin family protein [Vibrio agarivorans]
MLSVRKSEDRGLASFSWLESKHSFSFGSYYDPDNMGFSALRVINDDIVAPHAGFETHGHRNMEIISFILEGTIEHKDSEGNTKTIKAGEFQLMSAGSGIYHSEFNASSTEPLRFLQIWVEPNRINSEPRYQQENFGKNPGVTTIATPSGENQSFQIYQDASLHQLVLLPQQELTLDLDHQRSLYVHQIEGVLDVEGHKLMPGDGLKVTDQQSIKVLNNSQQTVLALVFDLP